MFLFSFFLCYFIISNKESSYDAKKSSLRLNNHVNQIETLKRNEKAPNIKSINEYLSELDNSHSIQAITTRASLKDLCAEDKQRIANLIKELAK
jgi:hypothetical protein